MRQPGKPRLPQRHLPHQPGLSPLHLFHAHDHVENHEKEKADARDENGIRLILDTRNGRKVCKDARVERNDRDAHPKERPERRLPECLLLAMPEIPGIGKGNKGNEGRDDLIRRDIHLLAED